MSGGSGHRAARRGVDRRLAKQREGRGARRRLAAGIEHFDEVSAVGAVTMPMMGLGIAKYHVVDETVGLLGVAIRAIDQSVGFVPLDVVDEGGDGPGRRFDLFG